MELQTEPRTDAGRFLVKPMTSEAEIAGKAFVHYTAWLETYPGLMPPEYLARRSLQKCEEAARTRPENTLVALEGERVVGFLAYLPRARDFVSVRPASEVTGLYVLKEHQGRGIGGALLDRALALLPERQVALFVLRGNENAVGFYRHRGFRFTGRELTQAVTGGELTELEMVLTR